MELNKEKLDAIKALIEYYIFGAKDGDYVLQAQILKGMCPNGW